MQREESELHESENYVLDSFALLAYLEDEPSSVHVEKLLDSAKEGNCYLFLCVVNLGEVAYITERRKGLEKARETLAYIDGLPIEIVDAGRKLALAAAHLKMDCPIAFADCFAAALSQQKHATLVTGDPEFSKLKPDCNVRIEWLG